MRLASTAIVLAGVLAACDSSITQPGLDENSSVAFAKGGNSEAAKACQNGGYSSLLGSNGEAFKNAGQCVSYVAKGGVLQPVGGGGGGAPVINGLERVDGSEICSTTPMTVDFIATFSGGTGTLNGVPVESGVAVRVPQTFDGFYTLSVTNGTITETLTQGLGGLLCT